MTLWKIAWRSIEHRSLASILTAFSMALGVALVVTVLVVHAIISQAFQRSAQGYNVVIGPKGSELDLVFSTVFYNKAPKGEVPYRLYEDIASKRLFADQVQTAIPIVVSEPYKNCPVIATYPDFFTKLEHGNARAYRFQKGGENFRVSDNYSAILGAAAAKTTKLKVGNTFRPNFGSGSNLKDEEGVEFTVVGILEPTATPNDRAIFINLEGFYEMQEKAENIIDTVAQGKNISKPDTTTTRERKLSAVLIVTTEKEQKAELTGQLTEKAQTKKNGNSNTSKDISDFETPPDADVAAAMQKHQALNPTVLAFRDIVNSNSEYNIQAVYPVEEVTLLLETTIGNIQLVLVILACLVVVVSGIGMMVSIYNTMNERRQEIAIMRALGAKRRTVMIIILLESILLSLTGGVFGFVMGHGLIGILSPWIASSVQVPVSMFNFQLVEIWLLPGLTILASIVGYLPAVIAYRTDVAQSLAP